MSTSRFMNPVTTQTWVNGRHEVRCVKVIQETYNVSTFCFMSEVPVMFFFKPGQFITLELEIDNEPVMRSYTISSSPSVPYSFSITVKRIPGGRVSNWLHDNLREGDLIAVHGPVGNFNCIDNPSDRVLMLSGGVGITPLMSMARWWFDTNADVDIVFIHSARAPKDIIFHPELQYMDARIRNFDLSIICERYDIGESWSGYLGFLDEAKLRLIAPDFLNRSIFCCGPAPYMAAVRSLLKANRFDMEHYFEESFAALPQDVRADVEELASEARERPEVNWAEQLEVRFSRTGKAISANPGETVHAAAARMGLHIPRACGMGICGTCKVRKMDGRVAMNHNGGITEEDLEAGYILSCCSVPETDVVVDV